MIVCGRPRIHRRSRGDSRTLLPERQSVCSIMMRRTRPWTALLANLVLVYAMWIGTGPSCVMADASKSHAGAMAGMGMTTATAPGMDMSAIPAEQSGAPSKAPADRQSPCRLPWALNGCQTMTPCAPLAITSPEQVLRDVDDTRVAVRGLRVLMPPTRAHPPEPPPPRA